MKRRFDYRNVVIAFFGVLILFAVAGRISAPVDYAAASFTSFFAKYFLLQGGKESTDASREPEVERLKKEVERLNSELARSDSEIHHLRGMLKSVSAFREGYELPAESVVPASVLLRNDTSNYRRSIVIDKGAKDGIQRGMVAVYGLAQSTEEGFCGAVVGCVAGVSEHAARILLITDPAVRLAVLVLETGDEGICEGNPASRIPLTLKYVESASAVKKGDRLVTSGAAGGFPRGLFVGKVVEIPNRGYGQLLTIRVEPAVDVGSISHVIILKAVTQPEEKQGPRGH